LENLKGKDYLEDMSLDGKIILEWILGKQGGRMWTGCIWIRIGINRGSCEHGNEPSGFIICGEFLD
jgi:hypothetical protein